MSNVSGAGASPAGDFQSFDIDAAAPGATTAAAATAGAYRPESSVLSSSPGIEAVGAGTATLVKGARGEAVKALEDALIVLGKLPRTPGSDGSFGPGTAGALASFQKSAGLTASGELDRKTLEALDRKLTNSAPAGTPDAKLPAPRTHALPAPAPITSKGPGAFLKGADERAAYQFAKDKIFTGADWRLGLKLAVTDEDTKAVLDRLEKLPPGAYNDVLHALAATKNDDPMQPTLLDKFICRGTSQFGNVDLSARFCKQLEEKLKPLGDSPQNKILRHISPDSVDRLKGWAGWEGFCEFAGMIGRAIL